MTIVEYPFSDVNGRMFYACVGVLYKSRNTLDGSDSPTDGTFLTGVQSIGVNSDFPSASLMDVGRVKKRFHYYAPQSFEITIERVIDQSSNFFYHVDDSDYTATVAGARQCHILHANNIGTTGRIDNAGKCLKNYDITILYGQDTKDRIERDPHPDPIPDGYVLEPERDLFQVTYRNCLITSISYNMANQGPVTESITLITRSATYNENIEAIDYTLLPKADQSGTTIQRHNLDFLREGDAWGTRYSILPEEVETMFLAKYKDDEDPPNYFSPSEPGGSEAMRILGINSISIEIGIEYSELSDVGKWRGLDDQGKQNLWRYVTLPVQVTSSFSGTLRQPFPRNTALLSKHGDKMFKFKSPEDPPSRSYLPNTDTTFSASNGLTGSSAEAKKDWNRVNREIRLVAKMFTSPSPNYFVWDLGQRNYLTGFSYDGAGTDGGNLEATMSYQNDCSDVVLVKDTVVRDLLSDADNSKLMF